MRYCVHSAKNRTSAQNNARKEGREQKNIVRGDLIPFNKNCALKKKVTARNYRKVLESVQGEKTGFQCSLPYISTSLLSPLPPRGTLGWGRMDPHPCLCHRPPPARREPWTRH